MKTRTSVLVGCLVAALCAPVGFAIAQAAMPSPEPPVGETREDPDPTTNPIELKSALERATAAGDREAEAAAAEAMRQEVLSRVPQADREAAEAAPPEPEVPAGTKTFIPDAITEETITHCRESLAGGSDEVCELVLLHAEGKVRSGAFSAEEQAEALEEAR